MILIAAACNSTPLPAAAASRLDGVWGSAQELFTAGADGATLDVPCATARIEHPIVIDANGRFDVDAAWITIRPVAPSEGDRTPPKEAVRISGEVRSGELALTVHFTDSKRMSERFTMTRGRMTRVPVCAQIRSDDQGRTA
ncbi:MAG: hypothetical protein QOI24_1044 [Acidobacteriota bacterium]|nr:hypothetical protein [Acidobacteriota bacterium]